MTSSPSTSGFVFQPGQTKKKQVADDLRRRISVGDLAIGDSLRDLWTMGDYYGCSWGTVREAQQTLVNEGLLAEIRAGMPTLVIARPVAREIPTTATNNALAQLKKIVRDLERAIADLETQMS